jgi:hypothetical protein
MLTEKNRLLDENTLDVNTSAQADWRSLYRLAGLGILFTFCLILLDMGLTFTGNDIETGAAGAAQWFALFQNSWFVGLRNLGLFNVINLAAAVPLYLALHNLHRKIFPALAALALVLYLFGAAVYTSSNQALTMLTLSSQYASAQTDAQRMQLETAGALTLAQAEDFTPGTFPGFLLNTSGSLLMMVIMLRARVFGKWMSLAGVVGTSCLLLFTVLVTFAPATFHLAMLLALTGGLLMLGWDLAIAAAMFRLGGMGAGSARQASLPA